MERSPQADMFEFADYFSVFRRRWPIVVLAGLLGLAAAAAYTVLAPKTYRAAATVLVTGSTAGATQVVNGRTTGLVDLDTEAQIVQSASVASMARQYLHSKLSQAALIKRVSVTVPPNSQVLQIGCGAHKPTAAARCAHAFAEAYLQNRSEETSAAVQTQLAALQQRVNSLQDKITKLTTEIKTLPRGSGPRVTASSELSLFNSQLATLSTHVANLTAQLANTSGGRIITDAVRPSSPSSPRRSLYLPSGLVAGLLVGLVIAFRKDRSDKRIRGGHELQAMLDLPVLLDLPTAKKGMPLALAEPRTRTGQAFVELAHSLASTLGQGNHVVLVAAASPGPAASLTAANLAAALSRTGSGVALVCADLRGSLTPQLFGLDRGPGLAEMILNHATVSDVEQRPARTPHLRVITPGAAADVATDHVEREVTDRLVARLHAVARYVIFEVAAAAHSPDVYAPAEVSDAAVVAVDVLRTLRDDVQETVRRLGKMGTPVLGAVLVPPLDRAGLLAAAGASATESPQSHGERHPPHADRVDTRPNFNPEDRLVYPSSPAKSTGRTTRTYAERYATPPSPPASTALSRPLPPLPEADGTDSAPGVTRG